MYLRSSILSLQLCGKSFAITLRKLRRNTGGNNGLVEDVVEEILIHVGSDSDDGSSDDELELDDDDL